MKKSPQIGNSKDVRSIQQNRIQTPEKPHKRHKQKVINSRLSRFKGHWDKKKCGLTNTDNQAHIHDFFKREVATAQTNAEDGRTTAEEMEDTIVLLDQ